MTPLGNQTETENETTRATPGGPVRSCQAFALLVLLRRFVPFEWFESFAVMGVAGSLVAEPTEVGPGQDVIGGVSGGEDEFRE